MRNSLTWLVGIAGILIIGAVIWYVTTLQPPTNVSDLRPIDVLDDIPSPIPQDSPLAVSSDVAALRVSGSSYLDPNGVYSFLYPGDYTLDSQENGRYIRVTKRAETSRPQSELSDGALVVFETVTLEEGQTLDSWVDERIEELTADGTAQLTQPKQAVMFNGYSAFTYDVRGLGESHYLVAQRNADSGSAVVITSLVADPEQRGYQAEVDAILATVELLK